RVTVSIGVAALRPGESIEQWLSRADKALYEAKRGGRNRCAVAVLAGKRSWDVRSGSLPHRILSIEAVAHDAKSGQRRGNQQSAFLHHPEQHGPGCAA